MILLEKLKQERNLFLEHVLKNFKINAFLESLEKEVSENLGIIVEDYHKQGYSYEEILNNLHDIKSFTRDVLWVDFVEEYLDKMEVNI